MVLWVFLTIVFTMIYGYISHLRATINEHETNIAVLEIKSKQQEWNKEIEEVTKKVSEIEIDYTKKSNDFRKQYGDGSSGDKPPSS